MEIVLVSRKFNASDYSFEISKQYKINILCNRCATFALRPGSNCRRVPGDPNAPYPGCCEKPVCPPKIKK